MDPTWQHWLSLIQMSVSESQHPWWADCVQSRRSPETPLLHHASLRVNRDRAFEFIRKLGAELGLLSLDQVDPLSLILVGIERDGDTMDMLSQKLAVPIDTVAIVAQLTALPLLLNAARTLSREAAASWQRGYCPVCGAWPSMAELRGIQRERRLRCGCCGSDWMLPVLRCAFCDEADHKTLGYLSSEHGDPQVRVETCNTCRGYLKTVTTLRTLPFTALAEKDLTTVAFDIAARDRGYTRPARTGWQVEVEIVQ